MPGPASLSRGLDGKGAGKEEGQGEGSANKIKLGKDWKSLLARKDGSQFKIGKHSES